MIRDATPDDVAAIHDMIVGLAEFEMEPDAEALRAGRKFPLTLVVNPPADARVMQEEIFAPVLPLLTVANLEEALDFIRQRPKPLSLYLFSRSLQAKERVLQSSSSGNVVINDTVLQAAAAGLPFGGVGPSGMGRCHGESGFLQLSNQRAVLQRRFALDLPWRYPPYRNTLSWMRRLLS